MENIPAFLKAAPLPLRKTPPYAMTRKEPFLVIPLCGFLYVPISSCFHLECFPGLGKGVCRDAGRCIYCRPPSS